MGRKAGKRKHPDDSDHEDNGDLPDEVLNLSDEEGGRLIEGIYIPPLTQNVCNVDANGPRLIITRIENNFFKSYAESQVLGPFHKCFNAIVGPNGSGKSNVIDSMLFVFGYRAAKIRSKKISVLLHNSEKYPHVQSCTVSVHFALIVDKEGDEYDIVPGSEFVVSRTAHKDSSSYFTLNGRRVHFKEVAKVLRGHGVDLDHNRFLILQGEVEQIAMMKPKAPNDQDVGFLEYLEDIIGTSRFKVPLIQLNEKQESLTRDRVEKLNRVKLVENDLNTLKEPMQDAVNFLQLENEISTNKNFIYQRCILDGEEKALETERDHESVRKEREEITENLNAVTKEKREKDSQLKEKSKKYDMLEKKREDLKEAFDAASKKDVELQAEMTQLNTTRKKNKELLIEEQKKLEQLERIPEKNQQTIEECIKKDKEFSVKKEKLEQEKTKMLASLRSETVGLQEKKDVLQTELVGLKKTVDEAKSALTIAESELKIYISNEEAEREKLDMLQTAHRETKEIISETTSVLSTLKKKVPLTEKSLNEAVLEANGIKVQQANIISEMRKKRAYVEESKSSMQASRSKGRVLDSLMQQKREGKCPGLFGRLGDLGAIDVKYDVAISTACGPLDNIVVDTVNTAQWCIEFLKQHNIGRATFIALEKQEHLREKAETQIRTPENVPRLYDLIRTNDDRVKTAFYYGLRDTLVANNIDQASRIAYGQHRYRVVTLGGDLIEIIGTMSGGGRSVLRGRMGRSVTVSNVDPKELENIEKTLEKMDETLRELRQRQNSLENQIGTLQPELNKMREDLHKFTCDLQSARERQPLLENQLKVQEQKAKNTKADQGMVKKLTNIVNSKKDVYEKAVAEANKIQVQVDRLTEEIKERTVGQMKSIDKKLKEVHKFIDNFQAEITRLQVGIKTAARNSKKSAEKIATLERDIVNAEEKLKVMKSQRDEIEQDAGQLLKLIEGISQQLSSGEDEYSELKKEVAAIAKKENKLKAEKIEIDQKHKVFVTKLNEIKAETVQYRAKLKQLEIHEIPEETVEELKEFQPEELTKRNLQLLLKETQLKEAQLKDIKPNLKVIEDYHNKRAAFVERSKELDEISEKKAKVKEALSFLKSKRREEFMIGFQTIRTKLKEMYQMITLGGNADFELVDAFDPFAEGVQFNVRPPKKSWKIISNLSGGEKTLSSLALVFALHYYKPSPLYVMDEIDAALDFKNVSIVANYIKDRTKNAQFIIISLRSNMFELCDYLIGIYKTFNCTKSCCIDPRVFDQKKINDEHESSTDRAIIGENETENVPDTEPVPHSSPNSSSTPTQTNSTQEPSSANHSTQEPSSANHSTQEPSSANHSTQESSSEHHSAHETSLDVGDSMEVVVPDSLEMVDEMIVDS